MKSTILLTTAIFLASAPSPDSKTVSEFSAGFLSPTADQGLMAAEPAADLQAGPGYSSYQLAEESSETTPELKGSQQAQSEAPPSPAQEQSQ